jgi:Tfp pilus assembly protein PilF
LALVSNRFSHATVVVALVVAVFGLYAPSLSNPLIWDDSIHLEKVRSRGVSAAFERVAGEYRRPIVLLSYGVQDALGLGSPMALHAFNVGVHAANAAMIYALAAALGSGMNVALAGAVLFAFHPLQSAAVGYVSGRTDLLAAWFALLAIAAALRSTRRRAAGVWAVLAGIAAALAGLSKEAGLIAGPLAAAFVYHARAHGARRGTVAAASALLGSLVAVPFVLPPAMFDVARVSLGDRFADAGTVLATYARLVVWPAGLHLDRLTPVWRGWIPLGVVFALGTLLLMRAFPRRPSVTRLGLLSVLAGYLPVSGIVPIYPALSGRWVFTPEHGLYMALAAAAPLFAYGVAYVSRGVATFVPGRLARVARLATLAIVPLAAAAWTGPVLARQQVLASEEKAYRTTLEYSPSPRACFNLGVLLLGEHRDAEAATLYDDCITISPKDAGMHVQLGIAYQRLGEPGKAELAFAKAVELDPDDALAWSNYANLDAAMGAYAPARKKWQRALAIDPGFAPALEGLRKLDLVEKEATDAAGLSRGALVPPPQP